MSGHSCSDALQEIAPEALGDVGLDAPDHRLVVGERHDLMRDVDAANAFRAEVIGPLLQVAAQEFWGEVFDGFPRLQAPPVQPRCHADEEEAGCRRAVKILVTVG